MFGSSLISLKSASEIDGTNMFGSNVGQDAMRQHVAGVRLHHHHGGALGPLGEVRSQSFCRCRSSVVTTLLPGIGGVTMRSLVFCPWR